MCVLSWNRFTAKLGQMGQKIRNEEAIEEYMRGGVTLRYLSGKYGISRGTLHRLVKAYQEDRQVEQPARGKALPEDVTKLQRELAEARLEAKIYRTMIDIAEKDLGIQIRKKRGAK